MHEDFHMMPLVLWLLWPMSTGAMSVPNRHGYYSKTLCEQTARGSVAPTGICLYYFPSGQKVLVHGTSFCHLRTEGTTIHSAQSTLYISPILLVYQSHVSGKSSILSHLLLSPNNSEGLTLDDLVLWVWAKRQSPKVTLIHVQVWLRVQTEELSCSLMRRYCLCGPSQVTQLQPQKHICILIYLLHYLGKDQVEKNKGYLLALCFHLHIKININDKLIVMQLSAVWLFIQGYS